MPAYAAILSRQPPTQSHLPPLCPLLQVLACSKRYVHDWTGALERRRGVWGEESWGRGGRGVGGIAGAGAGRRVPQCLNAVWQHFWAVQYMKGLGGGHARGARKGRGPGLGKGRRGWHTPACMVVGQQEQE